MSVYQITLIHAGGREIRTVIASSSMRACATAINMLPDMPGTVTVVCNPGRVLS